MVDLVRKNANANGSGELTNTDQTIAGVKTFNDGIKLDNDAGQSTLNYYRTGTGSGTFSGMTTSPSITATFVRTGAAVIMRIGTGNTTLTKNGSNGPIVLSGIVPTWARSSVETNVQLWGSNAGAIRNLYARIKTDGNIDIYSETFGNIAANAINCGVQSSASASWIVTL